MVSQKTFSICVGRVWIVLGYFLFEKLAFNGLLKVIGMHNMLLIFTSQFIVTYD